MDSMWLDMYLKDAVARNLCTMIHCTTCGAEKFRFGLGLLRNSGVSLDRRRNHHLDIANALAGITSPESDDRYQPEIYRSSDKLEEAVRCIIFDLWTGLPFLDQEVEQRLGDSWAGNVLQKMKEHYRQKCIVRNLHDEDNSPEKIHVREEERKRLKQLKQKAHLKRLQLKVERDKLWHQAKSKALQGAEG